MIKHSGRLALNPLQTPKQSNQQTQRCAEETEIGTTAGKWAVLPIIGTTAGIRAVLPIVLEQPDDEIQKWHNF